VDENKTLKIESLFKLLKASYLSNLKAPNLEPQRQTPQRQTPQENSTEANALKYENERYHLEILELNDQLKEASEMIGKMDQTINSLSDDLRVSKKSKIAQSQEYLGKEGQFENELLELYDQLKKYKNLANSQKNQNKSNGDQEIFTQKFDTNASGDFGGLSRDALTRRNEELEIEVEDLQMGIIRNQEVNLDIVNDLNERLDTSAFIIAQLKLSGGKIGTTKIGGLAGAFKGVFGALGGGAGKNSTAGSKKQMPLKGGGLFGGLTSGAVSKRKPTEETPQRDGPQGKKYKSVFG
jgi:hypothetical protein